MFVALKLSIFFHWVLKVQVLGKKASCSLQLSFEPSRSWAWEHGCNLKQHQGTEINPDLLLLRFSFLKWDFQFNSGVLTFIKDKYIWDTGWHGTKHIGLDLDLIGEKLCEDQNKVKTSLEQNVHLFGMWSARLAHIPVDTWYSMLWCIVTLPGV